MLNKEIIRRSDLEIKEFFRESYGVLYKGDKNYDEFYLKYATNIIETNEAMAIMIGWRISAVATKKDSKNRMVAMIELLKNCKQANDNCWVSVGVQYESMKYACEVSDMHVATTEEKVRHLLKNTILNETYNISEENGIVYIAKITTPEYKQVVYL